MPAPLVDLHMHTTASDGDLEPEELVARCAAAGLGTIAVTDHNSTVHVTRAGEECGRRGLELIAACEISTRWHDREHHCLAYFVPIDDPAFTARIERVRRADLERSRRWVENAAVQGFAITLASGADYFLNFRKRIEEARRRLAERVPSESVGG